VYAGWFAGLLFATFPVDSRYASILVPEPVVQCVVLAGALVFLSAVESGRSSLGIAAGVLFGAGFLTKEPGAFVAAAFAAWAVATKRWSLALNVSAGACAIVAGELIWHAWTTADPLFRLHAIHTGHDSSGMAVIANEHLSYRLLQSYPRMMLIPNVDFGLHSVVALLLGGLAVLLRPIRNVGLFVAWAALPWLYLNFGSSSLSSYWALPAAPRYIALVYAPLFILTACVVARHRRLVILLPVVVVVGIVCTLETAGQGYNTGTVRKIRRSCGALGGRLTLREAQIRRLVCPAQDLGKPPQPSTELRPES
jgi:4-amino-4-deoxy-L-arabinose transferase-like glycosyltransferase